MPVIVQPKDYGRWLDPENGDVADIIAPPSSEGWIAYPVNRRLNSRKTTTRSWLSLKLDPLAQVAAARMYEACERKGEKNKSAGFGDGSGAVLNLYVQVAKKIWSRDFAVGREEERQSD
jgi:hypothetical protein